MYNEHKMSFEDLP